MLLLQEFMTLWSRPEWVHMQKMEQKHTHMRNTETISQFSWSSLSGCHQCFLTCASSNHYSCWSVQSTWQVTIIIQQRNSTVSQATIWITTLTDGVCCSAIARSVSGICPSAMHLLRQCFSLSIVFIVWCIWQNLTCWSIQLRHDIWQTIMDDDRLTDTFGDHDSVGLAQPNPRKTIKTADQFRPCKSLYTNTDH